MAFSSEAGNELLAHLAVTLGPVTTWACVSPHGPGWGWKGMAFPDAPHLCCPAGGAASDGALRLSVSTSSSCGARQETRGELQGLGLAQAARRQGHPEAEPGPPPSLQPSLSIRLPLDAPLSGPKASPRHPSRSRRSHGSRRERVGSRAGPPPGVKPRRRPLRRCISPTGCACAGPSPQDSSPPRLPGEPDGPRRVRTPTCNLAAQAPGLGLHTPHGSPTD